MNASHMTFLGIAGLLGQDAPSGQEAQRAPGLSSVSSRTAQVAKTVLLCTTVEGAGYNPGEDGVTPY
jgi:hypothetical protein